MSDTYTTNYGLVKIEIGTTGWGDKANGNMDVIDTQIKALSTLVLGSGTYAHSSLTGLSDSNCHPAAAITNTPSGTISATNVQEAINEIDTEKAALAGATFTGNVGVGGPPLGKMTIVSNTTYNNVTGPLAITSDNTASYDVAIGIGVDATSHAAYIQSASYNSYTNRPLLLNPNGGDVTVGGVLTAPGVYSNTDASAPNVYVDASGNLKRSTFSSGSGIVNNGASTALAYYPSAGTTVDDSLATMFQNSSLTSLRVPSPVDGNVNVAINARSLTGDPTLAFSVNIDGTSVSTAMGIDNSDSDKFKIAMASDLSGAAALTIDTTGALTVPGVYSNTQASMPNVYVDSSGNLKRATVSPGSGAVNSGVQYSLAYYPYTDTTVDDATWLQANTGSGTNKLTISSTSTDKSVLQITTATADAMIYMLTSGGYEWSMGIDYSESTFVIAAEEILGTGLDKLRLNATGQLELPITGSSASTPAIFFGGDTNCGIFHPGNDVIAFTTGGTEAVRITGGIVGIGESSPGTLLTVGSNSDTSNQNIRINGKTSTGAASGTLTNAPSAGNPVGYLSVNINGTERKIPYW